MNLKRADAIVNQYPGLTGMQWRMRAADVVSRSENDEEPRASWRSRRWRNDRQAEKEFRFSILFEKT